MKRGFFLRGMLRRGMLEMHRSRPLASSAAVSAIPLRHSPLQPRGFNVVERKLASGSLNGEGDFKVIYQELYSRITKDVVVTSVPQFVPGDEIQCAWIAEASVKETMFNTPGFPARISTPRRLDLYEVRPTSDMGMGLFAKRDMQRGELILAERPLLVVPFGMEASPKSAIPIDLQTLELRITEFKSLLEAAIARLSPGSQDAFKALHNACPGDHLLGITFTNGYAVSLYDGSPIVIANCKVASRINHSCMPNVQFNFQSSSFSMRVHASRDIKTGDQLLVSYGQANSNVAERRAGHAAYGFVCQCSACINATPKADQLRESFEIEIDLLNNVAVYDPLKINQPLLEKALMLEKDMVEEGLDVQPKFELLLLWICLAYARLGKVEESDMYRVRAEEFGYFET